MKHPLRKIVRAFAGAAEFRFYGELNDFLKPERRQRTVPYRFAGHPGIKDPIEALGVPHVEVDLLVVNGESVGFDYQLRSGDRVAVYPGFGDLDLSPAVRLRAAPGGPPAFVVDVNLGRLARLLRLLGFDTLYSNSFRDAEIVAIAAHQGRIVLTRDRKLLHAAAVVHGRWVRSVVPARQLDEVVRRFELAAGIRPFARCADCNGPIEAVAKDRIVDRLEPGTRRYFDTFYRCTGCGKLFWQGSHVGQLRERLPNYL